jgi:hypothetical protein
MIRAMAAEGNKSREAPPLTPAENEAFLRMLRDAGQRYIYAPCSLLVEFFSAGVPIPCTVIIVEL